MAEHQPGSTRMYHQYLHHIFYLVPIGFFLSLFTTSDSNSDAFDTPGKRSASENSWVM